jgi:hypothetical protein
MKEQEPGKHAHLSLAVGLYNYDKSGAIGYGRAARKKGCNGGPPERPTEAT